MTQSHDDATRQRASPLQDDVDADGDVVRARPSRPTIHDEPTLVEDGPAPVPATTEHGHRFPAGLERLADRYRLEEPIASGGAAVVWRAFDEVLSRTVAIKLLHPHLAGDPRTVERFRLESVNAARLAHPNVVAIYDTGQEQDVVYLVMEHVEGPTLREILADVDGGLEPEQVAALGEQVASALGEAHAQGLVHRDVKPANILLTPDGVAKVTDFGIAKALSSTEAVTTSPGTLIGTAAYIAPEQLSPTAPVDARADVYSLGVVLHEALTGHRAFRGDTAAATAAARLERELLPPRQVRADVPRVLDDVVVRATRRDVEERFPDGTSMALALQPLVRQRPSDATVGLVRDRLVPNEPAPVTYLDEPSDPRRSVRLQRGRLLSAFAAGLAVALAMVALLRSPAAEEPADLAAPVTVGDGVEVFALSDFDPYGGDRENPDDVTNLLDGDTSTTWATQAYAAPLRSLGTPGVGVWLDLGEPVSVDRVEVVLATPGVTFELLVRDEPPSPGLFEVDWRPVATAEEVGGTVEVDADDTTSRYWLVWFTELAPRGERFQAEVAELRFVETS